MTIVNIGPNIALGGRAKACKIIGCNSEWSPKRGDSTNQKRLAVYACANRDVFAGFLSSRRHNLPSKVKLCYNQTERNVYMWMQQ